MEISSARRITLDLYKYILNRDPDAAELTLWSTKLVDGEAIESIIRAFGESAEYKRKNAVTPFFPPGHYYSPIVLPDDDVREYISKEISRIGQAPQGIDMMLSRMKSFFRANAGFMASANYTSSKNPKQRYYFDNGGYPLGDALTLRAMLNYLRPKRIIEVGSGFSTACMLDTFEEIGLTDIELTCIEPNPDRLLSLVRPGDKIDLLACAVQKVSIDRFECLGENDILFIDSTHIMKTGSDVHYELFNILPVLKKGVMIHFHDLQYPFEYPLEWVFDQNYSWNEAYAVRAFLSYNEHFAPFYSSTMLAQTERALIESLFPNFPANPGSGLWIRRERK